MTTMSLKHALPTTSRSADLGAGLLTVLRREWSYFKAAREMNRLDDAALSDVGVTRGSIDEAVRHGR